VEAVGADGEDDGDVNGAVCMKSVTKVEKKLLDAETRAEKEVAMADAGFWVDFGADADEDAEVGAGVERGAEVEGGDRFEEHDEVELGAEFESSATIDANTEDESAPELVVVVKVDIWLNGS
jgi:hypothetical protein